MDNYERQIALDMQRLLDRLIAYAEGRNDNAALRRAQFSPINRGQPRVSGQEFPPSGTAPSQFNMQNNSGEGDGTMPLKLKYGQGTICKRIRKTKRGDYVYWQGRVMDNGQQRTVTAKTQAECLKRLKDIRNSIVKGEKRKFAPIYGEWLQKWYQTFKVPFLKPSSLSSIETCIRLHIPDALKRKPMDRINGLDLQEALNSVKFPRQKDVVYQILCASFRQAKASGLIKNEPQLALVYKKHKCAKSNILTITQQELILKDAAPEVRRAILGYLWTGCRLRELLNMRWRDIDFDARKIRIYGTKSASSLRTIPLFDQLAAVLGAPGKPDDYVFNLKPDWLSRKFASLCHSHGIEGITIHSLRHTFGSRMRSYGVDFKSIQAMMGHSSIKVTMDIYVHEIEEFEASVVDKVNKLKYTD